MERKNEFRKKTYKNYFGALLSLYIIMFTISTLFGNLSIVNAEIKKEGLRVYVDSVVVQRGDSLWSIAKSHHSEFYSNTVEYVAAIKECNGLKNDVIHPGDRILVPYTERE